MTDAPVGFGDPSHISGPTPSIGGYTACLLCAHQIARYDKSAGCQDPARSHPECDRLESDVSDETVEETPESTETTEIPEVEAPVESDPVPESEPETPESPESPESDPTPSDSSDPTVYQGQ